MHAIKLSATEDMDDQVARSGVVVSDLTEGLVVLEQKNPPPPLGRADANKRIFPPQNVSVWGGKQY